MLVSYKVVFKTFCINAPTYATGLVKVHGDGEVEILRAKSSIGVMRLS